MGVGRRDRVGVASIGEPAEQAGVIAGGPGGGVLGILGQDILVHADGGGVVAFGHGLLGGDEPWILGLCRLIVGRPRQLLGGNAGKLPGHGVFHRGNPLGEGFFRLATGKVSDRLAGGNGHHGGQPLHPKHAGNIGGGIGVGVPEHKRIMTGLGQVGEVGA